MFQKFIIIGRLPDLNQYIDFCRQNKFGANKIKKDAESRISLSALSLLPLPEKFTISITWYEKDSRRDWDNIIFAKKFILDALVKTGKVKNDSRKYINSGKDIVLVDKINPRIEVELEELNGN
jgi:Holliday junction resolvase RusA-like endonuclease